MLLLLLLLVTTLSGGGDGRWWLIANIRQFEHSSVAIGVEANANVRG